MKTLPRWFKKEIPDINLIRGRLNLFRKLNLHTVCVSAHCPNMAECFSKRAVTFMILGDICTRNCRFCAVDKGKPKDLDIDESANIAKAVRELNLDYVVITSVTRDDLSDGGASVFADTVSQIKKIKPETRIELLIPDFHGKKEDVEKVIYSYPDVVGHNIETVKRLYPTARPMADYEQSLNVIRTIKQINKSILTKSAILLGMGENWQEVVAAMNDLRKVDCNILTMGQYLSPSDKHLKVDRFVSPEEFKEYKDLAYTLGFSSIASGPFVRSSYNASELLALLT